MDKPFRSYLTWAIAATIWSTICFILPDFIDNPINGIRSIAMIGFYLVAIGGASFWVLYLIGLNRYLCAVLLPIWGISGAAVSYFRVAFHATVTPMVVDATLHTNGGTIAGVMSWQLIAWIAIQVCIVIDFIYWRWQISEMPRKWIHAIVVSVLLIGYYNAHWHLKSAINQRYPYHIVASVIEYAKQQQQIQGERTIMPYRVVQTPDSLDIIFVLGEAARADHLQLNGYARETTPRLSARTNIVSLGHVYSEHTYTSTSVPLILSPADSIHPERCVSHSGFIRVLNENGYRSAWISNQDNGQKYAAFIHESDTVLFPNASKSVFVFDPWYDEQLLGPLDSLMKEDGAKRIFAFHMIGSHWYYDLHVPEALQVFTPLTHDRIITNNSIEQVTNSYDNTILAMDAFVDSLIMRFEHRKAILIYISDHGESLGEGGDYLHAGENIYLHWPACMVWYSDAYAACYPDKIAALHAHQDQHYRTDIIYPSVLSAAGIESEGSENLSIFE